MLDSLQSKEVITTITFTKIFHLTSLHSNLRGQRTQTCFQMMPMPKLLIKQDVLGKLAKDVSPQLEGNS